MVTSTDLNRGTSVASANTAAPQQQITRADLFPVRPQRLGNIEQIGSIDHLQFPLDRSEKYHMSLGISDYSRSMNSLMQVSANFSQTGNIILPMPQQMVDSHSVSYEQKAIGQFTGAATETAGSVLGMDGVGAVTNFVQSAIAGLSQTMANAFGSVNFNAADAARATTGMAPNQFLTVLLQGPQYKKYEFSWKLSPRNEAESEQIRKIIVTLNKSMAPGLDGTQAFFTFPKIFKVSFSNSGVLYRFKPSVLENMTINYAPSGAPAFYSRTGAPDTVELRLQFLEIEFWLNNDPDWEGTPIPTQIQGGR